MKPPLDRKKTQIQPGQDDLLLHLLTYFFIFILFLQPHLQHLEVPRLGVGLELQLPAYTTATATPDPQPTK